VERSVRGFNEGTIRNLPADLEKVTKISITIFGVKADMRIGKNISEEVYKNLMSNCSFMDISGKFI
jgi:hypothetical protein